MNECFYGNLFLFIENAESVVYYTTLLALLNCLLWVIVEAVIHAGNKMTFLPQFACLSKNSQLNLIPLTDCEMAI